MRAILAIGLIALIVGLVVQTLRLRQSAAKNQQLESQIAELRSVAAAAGASPGAATSSDGEDRTELLRLRNQVAQLRAATNELHELRAAIEHSPASPPATRPGAEFVPRESWTFAGYATPEAAFQSMFFAMNQRDQNAFVEALSPEEIVLVIYAGADAGLLPMQMKKINDQWKFGGVATDRR